MKALILAAGYGRRMRPLTDSRHKTLLEVGGVPILARIVDSLHANGVHDIVIVTGYRADELRAFLSDRYPGHTFQFVNNARYQETNNIVSLAMAFDALDIQDDLLLIESDLVYESKVIERAMSSPHSNVALVDHFQSGMDGTVVEVSDEIITQIIPPHLQGPDFNFSDKFKTLNIYKFDKDFCNGAFKKLLTYYARTIDSNCYYELVLGILVNLQRQTIHAEVVSGLEWTEVDDPNDLWRAEYLFNPSQRLEQVESTFGGYWEADFVDFCFIRNMYFPTPAVDSELKHALPSLLRSYSSSQRVLNRKLSYFLLCHADRVQLTNGCSQVYPWLGSLFEDRSVLLPTPTFGEYKRVLPRHRTYPDAPGVSIHDIRGASVAGDVVVVVNPNNPTGSTQPTDELHAWILHDQDKTFVVDESFIDFSGQTPLRERLEREPLDNVIVLHSLSKCLGVPGLRLGFVYSQNREFQAFFERQLPVWNANSVAEFYLELLLKQRSEIQESIRLTIRDRETFAESLSRVCGITPFPSGANFILFRIDNRPASEGRQLVRWLLTDKGIYIKDISERYQPGDQIYLRAAVRKPEENQGLVNAIEEYLRR